MKDQQFYNKIKLLVSVHLGLENQLQDIQQRQNQKNNKIQDSTQNKKMTRAALAKRNQQSQQQLRKDQIYVRLTPKTQNCLQWMLCNRNFPRIECKLSCNQHLQYLVNYLSNKWLRNKGNYKIVLYADMGTFLKNSLNAKDRQRILKQPLNNYFMFTDVMVSCGIGQNGNLNLNYDIMQKKKETHPRNNTLVNNNEVKINNQKSLESIKRISQIYDEKLIRSNNQFEDKNLTSQGLNNKNALSKYVPMMNNNTIIKNSIKKPQKIQHQMNQYNNNNKHNNMNQQVHQNSEFLLNIHNQHSNNFGLGNESNLLNSHRNVYNDQESIFKSIGFFGIGNGYNSIGFAKKNDYNIMSINSNSYLDVQSQNTNRKNQKNIDDLNINKNSNHNRKNNHNDCSDSKIYLEKSKQIDKSKSKQIQIQKSTHQIKGFSQVKQKQKQKQKQEINNSQSKKTNKLIDLRNAINFVEVTQGFNDQPNVKQQISQKSLLKQIKTVSIKKKTIN